MRQKKTSELFTLRVKVGEENEKMTVNLSCEKGGKDVGIGSLKGDDLNAAYNSMAYATSMLARLLVEQLHDEGKMSDEEFYKLTSSSHEQANEK